jgi:hypothetical protein
MNHKFIPAVAAFLILGMLLSAVPLSYAQTYSIGPKLDVVTIPQDDQILNTGVMILGIDPTDPTVQGPSDFMSQHKLIITYNGMPLTWDLTEAGPTVVCNVLEKDKVNVVPDPKDGTGKQFDSENLMTVLVDVSANFVCKPRWKSPATGMLESVGVLDVYYVGPNVAEATLGTTAPATGTNPAYFIADNILVVEAFFSAGRTVVFGSDIQDICLLGWAVDSADVAAAADPTFIITKPDGTQHYIWQNSMGWFVSCESLALAQRAVLGIPLATGQDYYTAA